MIKSMPMTCQHGKHSVKRFRLRGACAGRLILLNGTLFCIFALYFVNLAGRDMQSKYRFSDPMMQPFVVFKGLDDGVLNDRSAEIFTAKPQTELFSTENLPPQSQ